MIKTEGSRGDVGDKSSWPGLPPSCPNSQSHGEAETEPNPGRGSCKNWGRKKRQDGGTIQTGSMDVIGELYEKENKLVRNLARRR